MIARRLRLTIAASLCALACALAAGAVPAMAGATHFGTNGEGSGQFDGPTGVGVDQATGDVYVADQENHRVDRFDGLGRFLEAWGWGVNEESPANELQTCMDCQKGAGGSGAGEYASEGPQGLAVDGDPLSSSYGDVYVVDWENYRVEKFSPAGEFLLMFGKGVNKTTGGDVCIADESCKQGTQGTANGQFEWVFRGGDIAVGPGGVVYVGDRARVQVFEASGVWRENISLSSLSSTGQVTALAVDAAGNMYVKDNEAPGVRKLEPSGVEASTQIDAGSESVQALAVDDSTNPLDPFKGDLFVGDSGGGFHVLEYGSAGEELASFGAHTAESTHGMAFSSVLGELYVTEVTEAEDVWILTPPTPGPLVEPGSELGTPGQRGTATLAATIDPEGAETTYHFEYVDAAHFNESGYARASSTPGVSIGSGFEDQPVSVHLTGLVPGGTYHWRVVAMSAKGTASGADEVLTTVPPALAEGPWATNVAGTSVTLSARIDPLGANTEYRLEYGTSASYGQTLSGSVGGGEGYVLVSYHRQGLLPGTTYHYRLLSSNEVGVVEGADHTFTTQAAGGQELTLPDGRAWELVSPPTKSGALIELLSSDPIQAASDGSAITYEASEPIGEDQQGKALLSQTLSRRVPGGWRSQDIDLPHALGKNAFEQAVLGFEYMVFSPDLSLAAVEEGGPLLQLSPEATEGRLYLRNNADGSFRALLTAANVLPGTKLADKTVRERLEFIDATPDLSHVIFKSALALTSEGQVSNSEIDHRLLYEWSAGRLQLVNILPNGKAAEASQLAGLGRGAGGIPHAVSSDGRWVAWSAGTNLYSQGNPLYVRDMVGEKTVRIGGRNALFETMSSDGSRVFFEEDGELYVFDPATGVQLDLTASHGAEGNGGVQDGLLGASNNGPYVYFVATSVLATGAVDGEDNLYVARENGSEWVTRYIATLSSSDEHSWVNKSNAESGNELGAVSSRVSPSGRYLAFMSNGSLTGYDNVDSSSGQPDEEVFLYDAVTGRLVCVSCNPTGARPTGVLENQTNVLMSSLNASGSEGWEGHWLAGVLPGWDQRDNSNLYQTRYLSDSGRLFFDSTDGLVPQDTNGLLDAYEYEPAGLDCTDASVTFSERSGGCVSLISSGTSNEESAFFDASESGDDVFFLTASRLTAADYDTSIDVYDAHVCTAAVPCVPAVVSAPPCSSGDSCKAAPSPQPEVFGPTASATFSGAGNVTEEAKPSAVKPETKPKAKHKHRARRRRRKAVRAGRHGAKASGRGGKR